MIRPFVFCPTCKRIRPMSITLALQAASDDQGEAGERVLLNYQCEVCCTLVLQQPVTDDMDDERVVYYELAPSLPMF